MNPDLPRVVVGIDGSDHSIRALDWAVVEARLRGARLEVIHVNFYRRELLEIFENFGRDERMVLDKALAHVSRLDPDLPVEGVVSDPPAAKALIDASKDADLLVVGTRGIGGFEGLAVGSVGMECLHHAHCPVAIIRRDATHP